MIEIVRQLGDVDQAVDLGIVEFDEQAEAGDAADDAVELAADVLFHPRRAVALVDFALGLIGATLAFRTLQRQRRHAALRIRERRRLRIGQRMLDRAMHQQIRIAADRRGEMRISLQRKTEVADVLGRIHRQRLAAQQDRLQQRRVGTLADLGQQRSEIARLHGGPWRHPQLELLEEFEQIGVLRFRRLVVDAIRRRHLFLQQEARGLDVRGDHAFFDQFVRVVALEHAGLHHFALRTQDETHFGRFEFDGAPRLARLRQHLVQLMQALHLRQQRTDLRDGIGIVLAHRLPHLGIGETGVRMHHRFIELRPADFAIETDLHVADEAQTVELRIQRADAIRQRFRQHRHDESREIHRSRAFLRFVVERRARTHVMRHIGNRDDQPETVPARFAPHRIVEILGVLAVDGHQRQLAQIDAAGDVAFGHLQRHRGGFGDHLRREFMRQVVAMDRGFHHQRGRELVAEHGEHAADRRAVGVGRMHDLAHHQLAVLRIEARVGRDLHVALDAGIVGLHITDAGFQREAADQPAQAALQHLDDDAFAAAATVDAGDAGHHPVAVQHLAHFQRRQEQVVALAGAGFGTQETEPVRIGDHGPGDQVHARGGQIAAAAVLQQLTVAQHRAEALAQRVAALGRVQAEAFGHVLGHHRAVGVAEQLEDGFAAGDGIGVARSFAGGVRVADGRGGACVGLSSGLRLGTALCRKGIGQPRRGFGRLAGRFARIAGISGFGGTTGFRWLG